MKKNIVIYLLCFAFGFMAYEVSDMKRQVSALENELAIQKQRADRIEVEAYDLRVAVEDLSMADP